MHLLDLQQITLVFVFNRMSILARLLESHPSCLEANDLQPILQMLHDFQLTIQYPVQLIVLHRIVRVLLAAEKGISAQSQLINAEFFADIWLKIAQTAFRTTSLNLLAENLRLLRQIVAVHRVFPNNVIESFVKTILSNSIRKSNDAVQLLIEIFKHYNVDALSGTDYRMQTMKWLLKTEQVVLNFESIRVEYVAELTALCLFSKIDPHCVDRTKEEVDSDANAEYVSGLRQNLKYKSMAELIVSRKDLRVVSESKRELPSANTLKSVVNEVHFQHLFDILNPDRELEESVNSLDAFNRVTTSLVLYLQLLNTLIAYDSIDQEGLRKTFLCKKIHFKVEQLEMCVSKFSSFREFTEKDAMDVMEGLSSVFRRDLHPVLVDVILSHHMPDTVRWLRQRIGIEPGKDSKSIVHRKVDELNCLNRLRYEAFGILSFFSHGTNDVEAFDVIDEFGFNLNSNTDLLIVQMLIKVS